jgi:RNA polymerase-binding transcription factor DksA
MENVERNLIKRAIETRLRRLEVILNEAGKPGADTKQMNQDTAARLDELSQIPVDGALLQIARIEQAELLANMLWLETDEAGLCGQCDTRIPLQRLLTVPTTRLCVHCASLEQKNT